LLRTTSPVTLESDERVATPAPEDKHPVAQPEIAVPLIAGEAKIDAQPFKSQTLVSSTMAAVEPSPPSVAMPMLDIFSFKGEIERQVCSICSLALASI
jgi:hypothetical protein